MHAWRWSDAPQADGASAPPLAVDDVVPTMDPTTAAANDCTAGVADEGAPCVADAVVPAAVETAEAVPAAVPAAVIADAPAKPDSDAPTIPEVVTEEVKSEAAVEADAVMVGAPKSKEELLRCALGDQYADIMSAVATCEELHTAEQNAAENVAIAIKGRDMDAARELKSTKERLESEKVAAVQALSPKLQAAVAAGAEGAVLDQLNGMIARLTQIA